MVEISLAGEKVQLLVQRALWWPSQKTLIVADVHWGKAGHFRRHGLMLPQRAGQANETKLAALVAHHRAERLIIAGDLFHSADNAEVENFTHWRTAHASLDIHFVMGNHDILPRDRYEGWRLAIHPERLDVAPFTIAHDDCDATGYLIHGHVHPGVRIGGRGRAGVSVACFAQDARRIILPAFGAFTGNFYLDAASFTHLYAVGDAEVVQVK